MFQNNLKIAWRNLVRHKTFSLINVFGLAISIAAFLLMALYIENELSFDRFHTNASRIVRVADDKQTPNIVLRSAASSAPVGPAMAADFPEVKEAVRLLGTEGLYKYNDRIFEERRVFFADPNVFRVFSFDLVSGNSKTALNEPMSLVLTQTAAARYFGKESALGKVMLVDEKPMEVTGVLKDLPENSHLQFDFLLSISTAMQKGSGYDWLFTNWYSNNGYTYLLLAENANRESLAAKLPAFDARHQKKGSTTSHHYALEKLTDIYLRSDRDNQAGKTGNLTNIIIFSVIAVFILLIACINFINLSTARATARAKEVGIKKVSGAGKGQMIVQFLFESFLTTFIALGIAVAMVAISLPVFNGFSGKSMLAAFFAPLHLLVLFCLLVLIGLLSGSYPAFILSSFKPVNALKGKIFASAGSISIRKGLVVFQFAVSVVLIICSVVVYNQLDFLLKHDLGFKTRQTMVINFEGDDQVINKMTRIRQELQSLPGVKSMTASSNVPGDLKSGDWSMDFAKGVGDTIKTEFPVYLADDSFLKQYGISMIAGRNLSLLVPADTMESILMNETAARKLGYASPEAALGLKAGMYPSDGKVVGVFKDFHFESLQKEVRPLVIRMIPGMYRRISVEMNTGNLKATVAGIENKWKQLVPERPIEYSFLDENFNQQYEAEIKFGQVFAAFTLLAIFVACLGLFGLALYSVQQRSKEIGIRKVLGASVQSIAMLVSKDFLKLVLIACIVGFPISGWMMSKWLQEYAYRIELGWPVFLFAGVTACLVALVTVGYQSIKAAIVNPVKSLKAN